VLFTSPIDVGDSTDVTVSYSNFAGVAAEDSVDCDDSTAVDSGFVCGASCDFSCGIYSDLGLHTIDVSLLDGITSIPCTSDNLTVNSPALPGAAEFQIVSFDLSEFFVSVDAGDSVVVDAVVKIRNIGGDAGDAFVEIVVKDMDGVAMLAVPLTASSPDLAVGASDEHAFVVSVLGSWEPDIYTFYANVGDGSPPLHDQKLKTLTLALIKPAPVPELPLFLVPLAAFSVLTMLFFAGKRKGLS